MRSTFLLTVTLCVGCSSGATTTVNPPPPPGGTTPAVLAVQAGDGQQAEPGAILTTKPMVAVKDAAGLGVAGVTVTFSVDSGGGSLQSTTAVTAANGTASPGDWHLGASEGRNVMSASVPSLPKIKFVATAVVGTVTVATQTVGSGGTTISITTGALAGTSLVIPAGAFTQNATWILEQRSNVDWPRRTGINPVGAVLHVTSTDTGRAAQDMMLTLAATVPPGMKPFVLIRDRSTNNIEVLQTVTVDPGTITVAVRSFDATWIAPPRLGAGGQGGIGRSSSALRSNGYDAEVVVSAIPVTDLDGDVDTGFRPGVDDWDFPAIPTSFKTPLGTIAVGATIDQMAYYASTKSSGGGQLYRKYQEIPGVILSNRVGLRAAAYGTSTAPTTEIYTSVATIRNSMRAGQADQVFYDVLKANLIVSRLPQMMVASVPGDWIPLTAYRVVGGRVDFTNSFKPGEGFSMQFTGGHFSLATIPSDAVGGAGAVAWIGATPIGQWLHMSAVAQELAAFAARQPPDNNNDWPANMVNARGGFVDDTILYLVDDTTRFWVECPTCKTGFASTLPPGRVERFQAYFNSPADGHLTFFNGPGADGKLIQNSESEDIRMGFVNLESDAGGDLWLDFRWMRAKRWVLTLPAGLAAEPGVETTYTIALDGPSSIPPHRFVWTFGTTATGLLTFASTTPSVTATLTQTGAIPVTLEMRRTSDDKVIAVGHGSVKVDTPIYTAWKLTNMTTALVNDTRGVDTRTADQGNQWLFLKANHDPVSRYGFLWSTYQADSTFLYTAQSANAAITLIARDTLLGPPFAPTTGFQRSIYWWTYGSFPTSAATPLTSGLKGSNNTLTRGGTSCRPAYSARFSQTGTLSAGQVTGLNWVTSETTSGVTEPIVLFEYNVTFNGDVATGTVTKTYRLNPDCNGNPEVTWSYQTTFTATRVR